MLAIENKSAGSPEKKKATFKAKYTLSDGIAAISCVVTDAQFNKFVS